jgi:hypothetical protein
MSIARTIITFPGSIADKSFTFFTRKELTQVLNMYGRLVSTGYIKDYAIHEEKDSVSFSFFRRTSERPAYMLVKTPAMKKKRGMYRVIGPNGQVLKRHENLRGVLKYFEPKLIKLVKE